MADLETIDRLMAAVMDLLKEVDEDLAEDWEFQTRVYESGRRTVEKFAHAAEMYGNLAPVYPVLKVVWKKTNLFWGLSVSYPSKIKFPRAKLEAAVRLVRLITAEILQDVDFSPDVVSVIKMDNGGHRFFDRWGQRIQEINQGEWPNDRFVPGAEIVMSRYAFTQEQARQWKEDIESWLLRDKAKCPPEVKARLRTRPI